MKGKPVPKGYFIAHIDINDADAYKNYVAANAKPFKEFGAKFLVRAGQHEVVEGQSRSRHVILEFESYQRALDCYNSPDYQHAISLRQPASDGDVIIIEGYDGPQPGHN